MSILVIGDSYAQARTLYKSDNKHCWANVLGRIRNTPIDNYGLGGSSLEYAYHMFQRHYDKNKHDIVIFTTTVPSRKFFFLRDETDKRLEKECFAYTIHNNQFFDVNSPNDSILNIAKLDKTTKEKIIKGLVKLDIHFPDSNDWKRDAIIESIQYRLGPKKKLLLLDIYELINVSNLDHKKFKMPRGSFKENDLRPCHMNISQNKYLAEYISEHLDGKIDIYKYLAEAEKFFPTASTVKETGLEKF